MRRFTSLELLLGAGSLVILAGLGFALVNPLLSLRQQRTMPSGLQAVTTAMRDCINNELAWAATVADPENKSMECLRQNKPCSADAIRPPASFIKLKASPGAADLCFQKFNTMPGVNTDGFTKDGVGCTGFNENGNSACPYRFNVYWTASCPNGEKACANPIVRVNGDLVVGANDKVNGSKVDLKRYSIRSVRGRADQSRYIFMAETAESGKVPASAPCRPGGSPRVFDAWFDPGNYITKPVKADGTITLEPGTYSCQISVPGYRVGNFKAVLLDTSRKPPVVLLHGTSEYSPGLDGHAQTRSEIAGTITLSQRSTLMVAQVCSGMPLQSKERAFTMGVPMNLGGKWREYYSVLQCWVLSRTVN